MVRIASAVVAASLFVSLVAAIEVLLRSSFPMLRYYDNRPGVTGGIPYTTNSFGMREIEFPLEKPESQLRVLALGDSTTFGMSERYEDSWPKQLEAMLASVAGDVFVINGAGKGRHPHLQLALFRESYWRTRPNVVILGFCMNDVVPRGSTLDQEHFLKDVREPSLAIRLMRQTEEVRRQLARFRIFGLAQYVGSRWFPAYDAEGLIRNFPYEFNSLGATAEYETAWRDTVEALRDLASEVRRTKAAFVLMPIPYRFMLSTDPRDNDRGFDRAWFTVDPISRLREVAAAERIHFVETAAALAQERQRMLRGEIAWDDLYIPLDYVHPNAAGYRVIARAAAEVVMPLIAAARNGG